MQDTLSAEPAMDDAEAASFSWDEDAATFGDRLALAREAQGMTQGQLGRRLGMRVATIKNWEADRSAPRANKLQMMAGLLNVSIMWLMTGNGDGPAASTETDDLVGLDLRDVLSEMRNLRLAQGRVNDRLAVLEKRLRTIAADL